MKKVLVLFTALFATLTIFSQPKLVGNLQWSDRSSNEMNWNSAVNYCQNLQESGYSDWRLPNVDELRTLIQNCPQTETGGQCKVSEKRGCLSFDCMRPDGSCYCAVRKNNGGYYSKLGDDSIALWSSSTGLDDWPTDTACYVGFTNGIVFIYEKSSLNYVRCVRDDSKLVNSKPSSSFAQASKSAQDQQACEYARKNNSAGIWQDYLQQFPQGVCSFEAKSEIKKLKKEDDKAAREAEYIKKGRKIGNLIWSDRSSTTMSWNDAKQYCENLTEGNFDDWRMPTLEELKTLIANGQSKFGDTELFWSSSPHSANQNFAWGVIFREGTVGYGMKPVSNTTYIRCVR